MEQGSLKSYAPLPPMDESSLDPNSSYAHILRFIEGAPKVVDFGCGPGNLARFLAQRGCTVFGVDINPESAGLAREYCADALIADLETASLLKLFPTERFDVAVFADILEHLRKPERLLAETLRILRPGGYVIASIPNIAHGAVRLAMMKGEFNYQEIGILDETHVRFFTLKTAEALLEGSGFLIEDITRTTAPIFEPTGSLVPAVDAGDFPSTITAEVTSAAESETLQFVIKAVPAASAEARDAADKRKIATLTLRMRELEQKLRAAKTELAEPNGVESSGTRLQERNAQLDELREQMAASNEREVSAKRYQRKLEKLNGQNAKSIAQLKRAIQEREVTIRGLQTELESAGETTEAHRLQLSVEVDELREQMAASNAREDAAKRYQRKLEKRSRQAEQLIVQLKSAIAEREVTIRGLHTEVESAGKHLHEKSTEAAEGLKEVNELWREISTLEGEIEKTRVDLAHAQTGARDLNTLYEKTEAHRLQLSIEIDELRKQMAASNAREEFAKRYQRRLEGEIEGLRKDGAHAQGRVRDLNTLYEKTEAHRLQLSVEIDELRGEYLKARRSNLASAEEAKTLRAELGEYERRRNVIECAMRDTKKQYAEALNELNQARAVSAELSGRLERDEFYLEEMRKSKFWRVRNGWFSLKRAFGITTDIP